MVCFVNSGRNVNKYINFNTEKHLFRHLQFYFQLGKITFVLDKFVKHIFLPPGGHPVSHK